MNHPADAPILRRSRSLAQTVVDALQAPIRDGRVEPGTKLPSEGEIMAAVGVSRTVVREALSRQIGRASCRERV